MNWDVAHDRQIKIAGVKAHVSFNAMCHAIKMNSLRMCLHMCWSHMSDWVLMCAGVCICVSAKISKYNNIDSVMRYLKHYDKHIEPNE